MLIDILRIVAAESGAKNLSDNPAIRAYLVSKINEAAEEIYEKSDPPGCLRESYIRVLANKQIALPPFMGKLRAVREKVLEWPWTLRDLRPRYHYEPWKNKIYTYRLIGYSPICIDITNSAPFTYSLEQADSDLIITTVGSTIDSKRAVDTITMDAASKEGVKQFNNVESISVNKLAAYDISVHDADNNLVALLYNDQQESRYAWWDVSQYPMTGECSDGRFVMEILYKLPLQRLYNDSDSFPVPGYDYIIAHKSIQLILEQQDGKEQKAILAHEKVNMRLQDKANDLTGTLESSFKVDPDPLLGMFTPWNNRSRRRMSKRC